MRAEAWRGVAGDVKATGARLGEVVGACYRAHPILALGGAAIFGVALASRRRPAPDRLKERRRGILGLLELATFWLGPTLRVVKAARQAE